MLLKNGLKLSIKLLIEKRNMQLAKLMVLSETDLARIHEATLDILQNCGVKVLNGRMLEFLKQKGLDVDTQTQIVKFTRSCVEAELAKIPPEFEVFDRNGHSLYRLGDGVPKIAAGHNAVFWVDSETGNTRNSTISDVELFAQICDSLEYIHMIGIPVMPQDVPDPKATLLYGLRAVIENSKKPVYFSTDSAKVNKACIDMLKVVFRGDLKNQVYGITQLSPTSPMFWEGNVVDAIMETVDTGVPIAILPEPNAGISAPYTLAGLLTMNNVECLSGLIMIQLLRPGTKVMYANSWTTTDMRSGAALVGSTETTICRIAAAQLARFYRVPSHTTAPNSDNHAHDEQNAWEKTFSQFCAVAAGHDLIVNCGMFATGMTCSNEQLLMDEEISAMAMRLFNGITVNEETIAKNLIMQIGPRGETYLTTDHTMKWLHSDEYMKTRLSVRGPRASWEASGGKDTYKIARERVRQFTSNPVMLDKAVRDRLQAIITQF
jgi:trimethylamine---corrinoid protein Co-methyltransferase